MTGESSETTRGTALVDGAVALVKRGVRWTARFYGAALAFGIVVFLLGLVQSAVPPLSGAIFVVRGLVALAGLVYLSTMLPTWLTERLERIQLGTGRGANWGRFYVLYRIFR